MQLDKAKNIEKKIFFKLFRKGNNHMYTKGKTLPTRVNSLDHKKTKQKQYVLHGEIPDFLGYSEEAK